MDVEAEVPEAQFAARGEPDDPELHLCIHCLAENLPNWNFCHSCAAPLNLCASTCPFERVWAEGWVYRSAVERPSPLLLFGMILLLLPQVGMSLLMFVKGSAVAGSSLDWRLSWLPAIVWSGLMIALLVRMAARWRSLNMPPAQDVEADGEGPDEL